MVYLAFLAVVFLFPADLPAQDYMVELFEEHYKEEMMVGGGESKIYHSWQVKSAYGDKLLIIVGDDHQYRAWLRQWMKNHKLFIVKIPDGGDERFQYDRAILVNVQQIHSVWEKKWSCNGCRHGPPPFRPPPEVVTTQAAQGI